MGYDGHVSHAKTKRDQIEMSNKAMNQITSAKADIKRVVSLDTKVTNVGGSVSTCVDAKNSKVT